MRISIIGGGIAGCATAYYLTGDGHDVTLFERDSVASHASGFALGGITPSISVTPSDPYEILSDVSIGLHRELAERLTDKQGTNLNFRRKPSLMLVKTPVEEANMCRAYSTYADNSSVDVRWLSIGELRHIDARISQQMLGGLYVGEAFEVDPYKLTLALWQAAEKRGAQLINREVTAITEQSNRVIGVTTKEGFIPADAVVAAAGPWNYALLSDIGVHVPLAPLKGQILRLDAPEPPLRVSLWWDSNYATTKTDGLTWVGTTEEEVGYDDRTTDTARDVIISSAIELLPYLEEAELVQQTACLRPMTPDRAPIIDAVPGPDGLVIATGGGRNGILLGPAMGLAASALATGLDSPVDVSAFSLGRFS